MGYRIKLDRDWACSPRGEKEVIVAKGEYTVPDDVSDYLADRILRSGRGRVIEDQPPEKPKAQRKPRAAPSNKAMASTDVENKEIARD